VMVGLSGGGGGKRRHSRPLTMPPLPEDTDDDNDDDDDEDAWGNDVASDDLFASLRAQAVVEEPTTYGADGTDEGAVAMAGGRGGGGGRGGDGGGGGGGAGRGGVRPYRAPSIDGAAAAVRLRVTLGLHVHTWWLRHRRQRRPPPPAPMAGFGPHRPPRRCTHRSSRPPACTRPRWRHWPGAARPSIVQRRASTWRCRWPRHCYLGATFGAAAALLGGPVWARPRRRRRQRRWRRQRRRLGRPRQRRPARVLPRGRGRTGGGWWRTPPRAPSGARPGRAWRGWTPAPPPVWRCSAGWRRGQPVLDAPLATLRPHQGRLDSHAPLAKAGTQPPPGRRRRGPTAPPRPRRAPPRWAPPGWSRTSQRRQSHRGPPRSSRSERGTPPPTRTRSLDGDVTTVTRDAPPSAAAAAAAPAALLYRKILALPEHLGDSLPRLHDSLGSPLTPRGGTSAPRGVPATPEGVPMTWCQTEPWSNFVTMGIGASPPSP